jgi:WD40 repeat protein
MSIWDQVAVVTTELAPGKSRTVQVKNVWSRLARAVSPDGQFLLVNGLPGGLVVRSSRTGAPVGPPLANAGSLLLAVFHPNGRALLTASRHHVAQVWDVANGKPGSPPFPHPAAIWALAFHPDGRQVLTACADGTARLWDLAAPRGSFRDVKGFKANYMAFSRDTSRVLAPGWKEVCLCETATGKRLLTLPTPKGLDRVAISPDGQVLALAAKADGKKGTPAKVSLWEADTGKQIGPVLVHPDFVGALAFSPDGGTLATGCADGKVRFWKVATGEPVGLVLDHPEAVTCLAFSPDGHNILTGCADKKGQARLWKRDTGELLRTFLHPRQIWALDITRKGNILLIGGFDGTARLWDVTTGGPIGPPLSHQPQPIRAGAFSPDGRIALTAGEYKVELWEAATGQPIGPPLNGTGPGTFKGAAVFTPDGQAVLVGDALKINIWGLKGQVAGEARQIVLSAQVLTGLELAPGGEIHPLDAATWEERRQRLKEQGGPLLP